MRSLAPAVVGLAVTLAIAGCGVAGGAQVLDASQADVTITADAMAFDTTDLHLPAGRPLTILLRNRDSALHNVAIYREEGGGDVVFVGDLVGTGDILYSVPALAPGTYFFRCDLHPMMAGQILVR